MIGSLPVFLSYLQEDKAADSILWSGLWKEGKSYDERQQQKQRDNKQARFVLPDFLLHNELRSVQTKTGIVQDYPDFAQGCSVSSSAFTLYMGDDTR